MAISLGEYQDVFLEEAEEQIENLNNSLLALEENHEDIGYINEIFRAAHSLKSSAAFVGLTHLSDLAHQMESLLQQVRDGQRQINVAIIDILFRCFDIIRSVIELVSKGEDPNIDMADILAELRKISEKKEIVKSVPKTKSTVPQKKEVIKKRSSVPETKSKSVFTDSERKIIIDGLRDKMKCFDIQITFEENTLALFARILLVYQQLGNIGLLVKAIPPMDKLNEEYTRRKARIIFLTDEDEHVVNNTADVDQVEKIDIKPIRLRVDSAPLNEQAKEETRATPPVSKAITTQSSKMSSSQVISKSMDEITKSISQTVKVPVKKLDDLLNNVAELVIANSGFFKIYDEIRNSYGSTNLATEFKNRIEQMTRIAKDLQSGIMNTRMIPIGIVFKRFNRLIRDLSREFKKNINLVLRGEETELDKKVIDSLGEPLMHLIRNSVDHGIEPVSEREAKGKEPVATILLNAYQGGNRIIVEVIDDGRGLSKKKIYQKALEKNLVSSTQLETMMDDDLFQLIFLPGFSTADKVTDISGRGVGMNVVKEVVSMMNGNVTVETQEGIGTKFSMTFPLTTAIISAIMVRSNNELYAIPLSDVIETIKVGEEEISTIENHEVIYLREDVLSLVRLNQVVATPMQSDNGKKKVPVVVVGFSNRKVGLVVDKLEGKQEIVIKSLEQNFRTVEGLSGASILGDGSIALILDVQSLINLAISNRVRLEEERYKRNITQRERNKKELSAEEYFKFYGKNKEVKKPALDSLEPGKQPDALPSEVLMDKIKKQDTEKKLSALQVMPELPETKTGEVTNQEEMISNAIESQIEEIRKNSRDYILKAAKDAGVEENLLDAKELEEIYSKNIDDKISEIHDATKEGVQKAAQNSASMDISEMEKIISNKVSEKISEIQKEAKKNIQEMAQKGQLEHNLLANESLENIKGVSSEEVLRQIGFSDHDMELLLEVTNKGVKNAAQSLSSMVNKKVEMAIPELKLVSFEQLKNEDKLLSGKRISFILRIMGDLGGHILLSLTEDDARRLVDLLYGMETGKTKEINEEALSALNEITNIIGSSIINVISEKTKLQALPSVPKIVKDFFSLIADGLIIGHGGEVDFAILMDTEFFISESALMGNLYLLPKKRSIIKMLERLRGNG